MDDEGYIEGNTGRRWTRSPSPSPPGRKLRRRARLCSTHFSTRIEGNRLTLVEAEEAISGREI